MARRKMTEEERKAFGIKMKNARLAKVNNNVNINNQEEATKTKEKESTVTLTQDQFKDLMGRLEKVEGNKVETVAPDNGFDQYGKPQGVIQRYSLDPSHYDNPIERLYDLEELRRHNLRDNYELVWDFDQTVYETKYGTSMADPKFSITLKKVIYDKSGNVTTKRIIVNTGIFFEDPASSIKEAIQIGLPIDKANTSEFLSQMRFLRYKQWLMEIFNPNLPDSTKPQITNQVIDGSVYQIEDYSVII